MFFSGPHVCCANPACPGRVELVLDKEVFVGERTGWYPAHVIGDQHCPRCGDLYGFSRRLTKAEAKTLHYDLEVLFQRETEEVIEWP